MLLDDATGELRSVAGKLFTLIEELAGEKPRPQKSGQWYMIGSRPKARLSVKLRGPGQSRADRYPPNSIVVKAGWDESLPYDWVERRPGDQKVRFVAAASDRDAVARAEKFIRWALGFPSSNVVTSTIFPIAGLTDLPLPEEVIEDDVFIEGAVRTVTVNAYERNAEARRQCVSAHGTECCICGFNFGDNYGSVAEGYIHVHHLRPLSEIGGEYIVDPIEDLRPVCPNCHAVLHLGGVCRTIDEVRDLMSVARHA